MSTIVEFQMEQILVRHRARNLVKPVMQAGVKVRCIGNICYDVVSPVFSGLLLITTTETSTPTYAVTGETATFDVVVTNETGVALTAFSLTTSHDGNGTLTLGAVQTSLAVAESVTIVISYTTNAEDFDVTFDVFASGTKPDTTTATSETIVELVDITGKFIPPPPP